MISIVICSINSEKLQRSTLMYQRLLAGTPFEIIPIQDAKSMAEAYNRGIRQSRGDLIIFAHDDVQFLADDFHAKLTGHMQHCDILGIAGTRRLEGAMWNTSGISYAYGQIAYPNCKGTHYFGIVLWPVPFRRVDHIHALDGVFLCARKSVAAQLGFDEQTYKAFHLYDVDFTFRAFLAGHRLAVACDLYPLHDSEGNYDKHWEQESQAFLQKFAGRLSTPPSEPWPSSNATIFVPTPQEVIQVMTPLHWDD